MQFSLELPTTEVDAPQEFVTAGAISEVVEAAVAAGFSAVNVTDHPAPDAKWLRHGGHHALDPFVALAFAAAADPSVRLHTNIYVAAYRNPFLGAKSVHSLNVLSGGRVILGVAAGYLRPEFRALGVDFDRRGALLDDCLAVLDAVSTGDVVTWSGDDFDARGVKFSPAGPSRQRPPVWVGGNSRAAIRRAARFDGWAPFHTGGHSGGARTAAIESTEDLAQAITEVRALAAPIPRRRDFEICWSEALASDAKTSADERCAHVAALRSAGVTWMTVTLSAPTRTEFLERIASFGREIISETSTTA